MDLSISGVVFHMSCYSWLFNQPWYAPGHIEISSQVTKVGTNGSLASLSSTVQLLTFKCHKNKIFTTSNSLCPLLHCAYSFFAF